MTEVNHGAILRALWRMAQPFKRQGLVIVVLTLIGTAADLVNPLIYRVAVNDIAGLFVEGGGIATLHRKAKSTALPAPPPAAAPTAEPSTHGSSIEAPPTATPGATKATPPRPKEPHQRGRVSPRSAEQALNTLLWAVALWFVLNLASHYFHLLADHRTTVLASRIEQGVIVDTFAHVLRLPLAFFSRRSSGGLTKQIDQLDQVAPVVTALSHQLLPELVRIVGIVAIMLTESWRLTLMALIMLPPYLVVVTFATRRLETGLDAYYETWEKITARIQDALGAIKTVKLSGAEPREAGRLRSEAGGAFDQYVNRNRRANRYQLWQAGLTYASEAIALAYGGYLVLERQLTPGDVVMFVAYLDKLYGPIEELSGLTVSMQEHFASLQRALRLAATPGAESGGAHLDAGAGHVAFRGVRFAYTADREVLHDVSFELAPGRVTALVGPSGVGKTTIVDLLLKLYEPAGGEILLDGQPLAAMNPSSLRAAVGMVAADGAIFRGTIGENIRYKRPDATPDEVRIAAAQAGLSATLERLPAGLDTEVGERGFGLSVGERQRVQIARVLVGRPRVLVLDEATANLDFDTENDIRRALLDNRSRPTTLVIAHRYSMVKDADWVIVLEQGRIVEQGSPAELAAKEGWFARFASAAGGDDDGIRDRDLEDDEESEDNANDPGTTDVEDESEDDPDEVEEEDERDDDGKGGK